MQAQLATKESGIGHKLLAVLMAVILAVGVALPTGALSGMKNAWADGTPEQNSDAYYWNNASDVKYFYWRFDRTDITTNNTSATGNDFTVVNDYAEHVTVTYSNGNGGAGTVPYTIYNDHTTGYTSSYNNQSSALNCSTVLRATSSSSFNGSSVRVVTDVGYVVTGYVIACETMSGQGKHIGEMCKTVSGYNLDVTLDTSGLYRSDITIDVTAATFGHDSNAKSNEQNNYVLLLQIAEVNVNVKVTKAADKESVAAGETVGYTVNATTTNDLTNVTFTDEFFKSATNVVVKYGDTQLTAATGASGFTYTGTPTKYYVDTSSGIIYLDGKWTSANAITITYDYVTNASQANTTITNTVIVTGTKTNTTSTVQDMGVAQVKVIVNTATEGSLRIYKTFSGLTTAEVVEALKTFTITVKDPSGNTVSTVGPTFYSSQTSTTPYTFVYFWDATNLEPGTSYTVIEAGTVDGYTTTSTYTVQVDGAEAATGNGTTATASVVAGKTTYVRFLNSYGNAVPAVKIVKQWKDAAGNLLTLSAEDELPDVSFVIKSDGTELGTVTLTKDDLSTQENAWVHYYVLDGAYSASSLSVEELAVDGYELDSAISIDYGKAYTVQETVTETDDDGKETTRIEEKTYDCTVFTAVNKPATTSVTIQKLVTGNMGDQSLTFDFTATLSGLTATQVSLLTAGGTEREGETGVYDFAAGYTVAVKGPNSDSTYDASITFDLAHGEDVVIAGLPLGKALGISEANGSYTIASVLKYVADATEGTTVSKDGNGAYSVSVSNGLRVVFTNNYDVSIDTGVIIQSLPYVLLLGGALIVGALLVGRMVTRREED